MPAVARCAFGRGEVLPALAQFGAQGALAMGCGSVRVHDGNPTEMRILCTAEMRRYL